MEYGGGMVECPTPRRGSTPAPCTNPSEKRYSRVSVEILESNFCNISLLVLFSKIKIILNRVEPMKIEYYSSDLAWSKFSNDLRSLVKNKGIKKVCDVGGGANPLFSLNELEIYSLDYTLLDISATELDKAPNLYKKIQADITDPNFSLTGDYDLVCSRFLAEHVPSGLRFHKNVHSLLINGGYAYHYFPTLFNLPYLANRMLPTALSEPILLFFQPFRVNEGNQGKFKAYYDCCRGPTQTNILRLESVGYSIEEYIGFFGHDFYERLKPFTFLQRLEDIKTNFLLRNPTPFLTQFAQVVLSKVN
jgi:uncharacterized UPF0146 family protein